MDFAETYDYLERGGPYFLVLDHQGQFKDVIVRTASHDFVRCMRSNEALASSSSDAHENFFAKPPKTGFLCNNVFFEDSELQTASKLAIRSQSRKKQSLYPLLHNGRPCDLPCLLWPIKPNGRLFGTGGIGTFRLVMTTKFEVMFVVIQNRDTMSKCEKTDISGGRHDHVKHDFKCKKTVFSHKELLAVAEVACKKETRGMFPARFDSLSFDIDGPYLIYPIRKNGEYNSNPGSHRVVMNINCKVAGAITKVKNEGFVKCKEIKNDNP